MESALGRDGMRAFTNAIRRRAFGHTSPGMSHAIPNEHFPSRSGGATCRIAISNSVAANVAPISEYGIAFTVVRPLAMEGSSVGDAMNVVSCTAPGSDP